MSDWYRDVYMQQMPPSRSAEQPVYTWKYQRNSGQTSRQMISAPKDAVYVVSGRPEYYSALAKFLQRGDLRIYAPSSLDKGATGRAVVLDHALTIRHHGERSALYHLIRRCDNDVNNWMNAQPQTVREGKDEWIITL